MLPSIRELDSANNYATDKLGRCPIHPHDYTSSYEFHFGRFREQPLTFWEIGVQRGDSLRLWSDYFPLATIVGLDIEQPPIDWSLPQRTHFRLVNATDPDAIYAVAAEFPPDIILDDGSHRARDLRKAFQLLWPLTKLLYVIEDFGTQFGLDGPQYLDASSFAEDIRRATESVVCGNPRCDCERVSWEQGQVYLYKRVAK